MTAVRGGGARSRRISRAYRDTVAAAARNLTKTYGRGETRVRALRGIDLDLPRGGFTAIMGPSGSGKSTLMHCLAALDQASDGELSCYGGEFLRYGKPPAVSRVGGVGCRVPRVELVGCGGLPYIGGVIGSCGWRGRRGMQ
ncbi:ATP-binding cassette domain-containing protein [Nonomuraea sp. NPDC001699]